VATSWDSKEYYQRYRSQGLIDREKGLIDKKLEESHIEETQEDPSSSNGE
jgi:hypothetical protein